MSRGREHLRGLDAKSAVFLLTLAMAFMLSAGASSAQVFAPCPNDDLRAGPSGDDAGLALPDCRAYEQVSPVDKNGTSLLGQLPPLKASPSGDRIAFESASGIPGGEGSQNFPYYLSTRGASDWSTQGLLPNALAGDGSKIIGWTRDFSFSYATVRREAAKEEAFVVRSSKDGSLETIVDYRSANLDPALAGTTADGSLVFFEEKAQLLPAATPGRYNLYVWERATDELSLAGVLPGDAIPFAGSFAGPYDWVNGASQKSLSEGGASRNYYSQDEHAVSEGGSRAYFTAAASGQLYLREDPASPSATTVNVSESQRATPDPAGTRPAAFMGATLDGSLAFFTSSEKLTDDATTGPELITFPAIAQAPSNDGDPVDLTFLPASASGLDIAAGFIYWIDRATNAIFRAKPNGDEKEELLNPTETGSAQDLAVNSEHIYWTNVGPLDAKGNPQAGQGTIGRAEIDGDLPNLSFITGASNPEGIDINATHVYWANAMKVVGSNGSIGCAELSGGGVDQKCFEVSLFNEIPHGLALSAARIYWTSNDNTGSGYVTSRKLDGSDEKLIFVGTAPTKAITTDATNVYWAVGNAIGKAGLDLSAPDLDFIPSAGNPLGLDVDAVNENLYWSANQVPVANPGNDLYRYDAETGELTDLIVDTTSPNGAEVRGVVDISDDGSRVYFAANGDLDGAGPAEMGDCKGDPVGGTGSCNLYLWEEGAAEPIFVALVQAGGGVGTDATNWMATPTEVFSSAFEKTARASDDGGVLLFRSQSKLTAYDNQGAPQLYRYEAETESIDCVSCPAIGQPPGAAPTLGSIAAFLTALNPTFERPASLQTRNLSDDGQRVFFETTEALVAGDTNGLSGCPKAGSESQGFPACRDVYMWEEQGSGTCESEAQNGGCLYLLSTGKSPEPSFFADASESGDDAFLLTSSPGLVGQDQDDLYDVFDARVGGGLVSQYPSRGICEGEGCKPASPPPPATESPPTTQSGPGDPLPERKKACPKGKRKVKAKNGKTRCVKRRKGKAKRARHNREASKTRRQSR